MAAGLLRAARAAPDDDPGDAISWAFSALPDSPVARKFKIELLLKQGDLEGADTLIAQGLLRRPTCPALCLLRARSLFARDSIERAVEELRLVLARRPGHGGALELAGEAAMRLDDARRAVELLVRALRSRPRQRTKSLLVNAWIAAGRPEFARRVMSTMTDPPPLLRARVLRAEGRVLEAIETLGEAAGDAAQPEHAAIVCMLIDLLEEAADAGRLAGILETIDADQPEALARAGTAWLGMGAFHTAIRRMARLARVPAYRQSALVVLLVAASMINRRTLAARTLERLRRASAAVDRAAVTDAWCRGLLGRLLIDQRSARKAGADPHTGRIELLLRDAAQVFEEDMADECPGPSSGERADLQTHLAICRQASTRFEDEAIEPPALAA